MTSKILKVTVLGCGDSAGVPRIGGDWGHCNPLEPKNRRTRPSLMVQSDTTTLVIDTGPDFGLQLTREKIQKIDAVLYTHAHSDHIAGLDDLRIISGRLGHKIPVFLDKNTYKTLGERYDYMFVQSSEYYPAIIDPVVFDEGQLGTVHTVGDIDFIPFVQDHGQGNRSLGFRFGDFAYSTDMCNLDEQALSVLSGIRTWIIDCADYAHGHGTLHADFNVVQRLNGIIQPDKTYLTHLKLFYDYNEMLAELPKGYEPSYDGMVIYTKV